MIQLDKLQVPQVEEEKKSKAQPPSNEPSPVKSGNGNNNIIGDDFEKPPIIEAGWSMFEKICKIGEGANGTVYKVKALKTTIFSSEDDGRIELNTPELVKKYGSQKPKLGINMHSSVEKGNKTRQLDVDKEYVIKEIDVSVLP